MPRRAHVDEKTINKMFAELVDYIDQTGGLERFRAEVSKVTDLELEEFNVWADGLHRRLSALRGVNPEAYDVLSTLSYENVWKLRKLLPKARGRKPGTWTVPNDLVRVFQNAVADGENARAAARRLLQARGTKGELKGKVDHLVTLLHRRIN